MNLNQDYDYIFKLLLIGNSGVGKSSLFLRFSDNVFNDSYVPTLNVDFKIRTVDLAGKQVKLYIWDIAGQVRCKTITSSYYKGAHGIILVYDVTDKQSFKDIEKWLAEVEKYANESFVRLLIGNKNDLEIREVSYEEGKELADSLNAKFIETSAKFNNNVEAAFFLLAEQMRVQLTASQPQVEVKDQNQNFHQVLKLILIGSSRVGKSCLLQRYCDGTFRSSFISTIVVDFKIKVIKVNGNDIKLQLFDISGNQRYKAITNAYYKCSGAMLVYDVTNRQSFEDIVQYHAEANHFNDGNVMQILIGNKSDLQSQRQVTIEEGQSLADKLNVKFIGMNILTKKHPLRVTHTLKKHSR